MLGANPFFFIFFTTHTAITIISKTKAKPPAAAPTMTPTFPESDDSSDDSCGASVATVVGADSTVIPSNSEAAAAVPRLEESVPCTATAVVPAGTAMVAVMITLAAATRIVCDERLVDACGGGDLQLQA